MTIHDPNRVGSLVFCSDCGNLLPVPDSEDILECDHCGRSEKAQLQEDVRIITRSSQDAFPSTLRQKRALVQHNNQSSHTQLAPLMDETCPKCKNPQMRYHTLQLRSADEGTTVFYECPVCGHKHSTNN
ncbi:hypothetical protein BY996DRAFT_6410958 [Phakopsora pachyrhizi]|nr:hypothetical protein BY996DRAFT_6410958 [Phakopsora pachyrhizi]